MDLTVFKVHFGLLTLKAYSKGEHVLRFEAIAHNTRQLGCGRVLEKFPEIVTRLAGMAERFCTALDCVHTAFIADGMLDELPRPAQLGKMRVGGIDLNKPRIRAVLQAVLALAAAPAGFTVADLTAKVCAMTGQQDYTARQAGYDLRKLRGKGLVARLGRTRRYHVPPLAARTITALLALRDQVIAPILAGIRSPQRRGRKPASWTAVDRDYEISASACSRSSSTWASTPLSPRHRRPDIDRQTICDHGTTSRARGGGDETLPGPGRRERGRTGAPGSAEPGVSGSISW